MKKKWGGSAPPADIRDWISYDPTTGHFVNIRTRHVSEKGKRIGHVDAKGYRRVVFRCAEYYEHALAWWYVTGEWPPDKTPTDHANLTRDDNRFANLRLATHAQNSQNRPSGSGRPKGSCKLRNGKFASRIAVDGKVLHLGTFDSRKAAEEAYARVADKLHGEFARVE